MALTSITSGSFDGGGDSAATDGASELAQVRLRLEDAAAGFDLIADDVRGDDGRLSRGGLPAQDDLGFQQPLRALANAACDDPGIVDRAVVDRDDGGDR